MQDSDYARLKHVAEKLAVVAISDADPANWDAPGITPGAMTQKQRGDAYWCRKLAAQTLTVLTKVMTVTGTIERATNSDEPPDFEAADAKRVNRQVATARREAKKMLDLVAKRSNARS